MPRTPIIHQPDNGDSFETLRTRALLKGSLEIVPMTPKQAARARLDELRGDKDWTRRYFAGDKEAVAEYDRLICISLNGVAPEQVEQPAPMTADELSDFYNRKYDSAIPAECLAAVEELRAKERLDRQEKERVMYLGRMLKGILGE
jgi:hypothetical protein